MYGEWVNCGCPYRENCRAVKTGRSLPQSGTWTVLKVMSSKRSQVQKGKYHPMDVKFPTSKTWVTEEERGREGAVREPTRRQEMSWVFTHGACL